MVPASLQLLELLTILGAPQVATAFLALLTTFFFLLDFADLCCSGLASSLQHTGFSLVAALRGFSSYSSWASLIMEHWL